MPENAYPEITESRQSIAARTMKKGAPESRPSAHFWGVEHQNNFSGSVRKTIRGTLFERCAILHTGRNVRPGRYKKGRRVNLGPDCGLSLREVRPHLNDCYGDLSTVRY
jgi:hypothetical protein